jgi:hypothetical protein
VTNYLSTLWVKEAGAGNGCRIEWKGRFILTGVGKEEASRLFRGS